MQVLGEKTQVNKAGIIAGLQNDILRLQSFNSLPNTSVDAGLGVMKSSFPNGSFPTAAIHEFVSSIPEDTAATNGFASSILSSLLGEYGIAIWISASRTLFPPALKSFGIEPDRFLFIDLQKEKDVLWTMEEALRCSAISVVIGELKELSFTNSRRLQLAVEQSQVTGFVLRNTCKNLQPTACVSRWKITSLPSETLEELPGIGFPKWKVELLRIRNGRPGAWELQWRDGRLIASEDIALIKSPLTPIRRAG